MSRTHLQMVGSEPKVFETVDFDELVTSTHVWLSAKGIFRCLAEPPKAFDTVDNNEGML